jgi:hypothetical protein
VDAAAIIGLIEFALPYLARLGEVILRESEPKPVTLEQRLAREKEIRDALVQTKSDGTVVMGAGPWAGGGVRPAV